MQRYSNQFSIGLTGGIGSGKTTVTNHFKLLGAGIIDADEVSRSITANGQPAIELLEKTFGENILSEKGVLNRDKLRQLVFSDADKKRQLEELLHPLIREKMCQLAASENKPYLIFSIPLLIEGKQQGAFDRILVVDAPIDLRTKWIKQRSALDDEQIQQIINSQASTAERVKFAHDIIENNDTLDHLYAQIEQLHASYLRQAEQAN